MRSGAPGRPRSHCSTERSRSVGAALSEAGLHSPPLAGVRHGRLQGRWGLVLGSLLRACALVLALPWLPSAAGLEGDLGYKRYPGCGDHRQPPGTSGQGQGEGFGVWELTYSREVGDGVPLGLLQGRSRCRKQGAGLFGELRGWRGCCGLTGSVCLIMFEPLFLLPTGAATNDPTSLAFGKMR